MANFFSSTDAFCQMKIWNRFRELEDAESSVIAHKCSFHGLVYKENLSVVTDSGHIEEEKVEGEEGKEDDEYEGEDLYQHLEGHENEGEDEAAQASIQEKSNVLFY